MSAKEQKNREKEERSHELSKNEMISSSYSSFDTVVRELIELLYRFSIVKQKQFF